MNATIFPPGRLRLLLRLSLLLNAAGCLLVAKRAYYVLRGGTPNPPAERAYYALNPQSVYDLFPIAKGDIVFAGDSHAENFDYDEYFPGCRIRNRGINGDLTSGLLKRIGPIASGRPRKLFVIAGYNDLSRGIRPDSACANLRSVLRTVKRESPETQLFVHSVFPSDRGYPGVDVRRNIPRLNAMLRRLCGEVGATYLDVYTVLSDGGRLKRQYDAGDGIHLNGKGYLAWSRALHQYFRQM